MASCAPLRSATGDISNSSKPTDAIQGTNVPLAVAIVDNPTLAPTAIQPRIETPTPVTCINKSIEDMEKNGISPEDQTSTPLSEVDVKSIAGYEKLKPELITGVNNLALKVGKNFISGISSVVVPEYAYDQVLSSMTEQKNKLGTDKGVIKYDLNNQEIFNNFGVLWLVPYVSANGQAMDSQGNTAFMYRNVEKISNLNGKLKPQGDLHLFTTIGQRGDGSDIYNINYIPGQKVGGRIDVVLGCFGTKIVKVDDKNELVAILLDNPEMKSPNSMTNVWKSITTVPTATATEIKVVEQFKSDAHLTDQESARYKDDSSAKSRF